MGIEICVDDRRLGLYDGFDRFTIYLGFSIFATCIVCF